MDIERNPPSKETWCGFSPLTGKRAKEVGPAYVRKKYQFYMPAWEEFVIGI